MYVIRARRTEPPCPYYLVSAMGDTCEPKRARRFETRAEAQKMLKALGRRARFYEIVPA